MSSVVVRACKTDTVLGFSLHSLVGSVEPQGMGPHLSNFLQIKRFKPVLKSMEGGSGVRSGVDVLYIINLS